MSVDGPKNPPPRLTTIPQAPAVGRPEDPVVPKRQEVTPTPAAQDARLTAGHRFLGGPAKAAAARTAQAEVRSGASWDDLGRDPAAAGRASTHTARSWSYGEAPPPPQPGARPAGEGPSGPSGPSSAGPATSPEEAGFLEDLNELGESARVIQEAIASLQTDLQARQASIKKAYEQLAELTEKRNREQDTLEEKAGSKGGGAEADAAKANVEYYDNQINAILDSLENDLKAVSQIKEEMDQKQQELRGKTEEAQQLRGQAEALGRERDLGAVETYLDRALEQAEGASLAAQELMELARFDRDSLTEHATSGGKPGGVDHDDGLRHSDGNGEWARALLDYNNRVEAELDVDRDGDHEDNLERYRKEYLDQLNAKAPTAGSSGNPPPPPGSRPSY